MKYLKENLENLWCDKSLSRDNLQMLKRLKSIMYRCRARKQWIRWREAFVGINIKSQCNTRSIPKCWFPPTCPNFHDHSVYSLSLASASIFPFYAFAQTINGQYMNVIVKFLCHTTKNSSCVNHVNSWDDREAQRCDCGPRACDHVAIAKVNGCLACGERARTHIGMITPRGTKW